VYDLRVPRKHVLASAATGPESVSQLCEPAISGIQKRKRRCQLAATHGPAQPTRTLHHSTLQVICRVQHWDVTILCSLKQKVSCFSVVCFLVITALAQKHVALSCAVSQRAR